MRECTHERTTALLDGVSCDDCGAFKADWGWGVASGKWFGSRALSDFYMRNGKSPEPQVDDRIAALAAENERLRKALILAEEQIVGLYNGIAPSARHEGSNAFADIDPIVEHIRQTLESNP